MFLYYIRWNGALVSALLVGCVAHPPCSLQPGLYSTTTAAPVRYAIYADEAAPPVADGKGDVSETISIEAKLTPNPAPFFDYDVVRYRADPSKCRDTFHLADLRQTNYQTTKMPAMPGVLLFSPTGLTIDEAEIPNIEWRQFEVASVAAGIQKSKVVPESTALPVSDYYTNPFYSYYPVVGISYEQAQKFCAWRTKRVNEQLAQSKPSLGVECEYRLPTEAEWEEAAAVKSGLPYGSACLQLPVQVAEKSAAYLKKRAGSQVSVTQLKADIANYNKQQVVRSWINCAQSTPYFLQLAAPGYVYQGPANYFGLFQMLGNAAEMVQERGITKGGSYRDELEACRIKARGHFDGPSPTVGFRAVCMVRRLK